LNWQTPTLSIYWWLVASLAFGIVLGWLASLRTKLQLRLQARQLKKELEQYRSAAQRDPERASAP
jgi:hypothetical protein